MPNEISVEMRLRLSKLKQDAQQAGKDINSGLASSVKGLGETSMEAQQRRERTARARRNAMLDAQDAKREASASTAAARAAGLDRAAFTRNIGFAGLAALHPSSYTAFAAARQSYKAFSTTSTGGGMAAGMGMSAAGAAAVVTGAALAVGLALKGLQKAIQETNAAIERSLNIYSKTLQSGGMAQSYVVSTSVLGQVLGVSQEQVMQYGRAIAFVNEKLAVAITALNETQRTLAATGINSRVMGETWHALWAKVAEAMAPALNMLYQLITAMMKLWILSGAATVLGYAIGALIEVMTKWLALVELVPAMFMAVMRSIFDGIRWLLAAVNNKLASNFLGRMMGFTKEAMPDFSKTKESWKAVGDIFKVLTEMSPKFKQQTPGTPVSINRLPASNWEKMGLVIGGAGGRDPARKTADNTTKMVGLLERLVGKGGVPRSGNFYDNSMYAQP